MLRTPWSMRSAPSSSIASRTPPGPLDSPAWAQRRSPAAAALRKAPAKRSLFDPLASFPSIERATTRSGRSARSQSTTS